VGRVDTSKMPAEIRGLSTGAAYFGFGGDDAERRRTADEAFQRVVAGIRRHYAIWPNLH
jgi:hypothetical protein